MKKHTACFVVGFIIIFFSTPLGYISTNTLGRIKGNLASEYIILLNGFIYSFLLIGALIFILGLIDKIKK